MTDEEFKKALGRCIRSRRREMGWSQAQLAGKLCVHRNSIVAWEAGRRDLPAAVLYRLCEELDVKGFWIELGKEKA